MDIRHGGQLREMGDAEHLLAAADLGQLLRHLLGSPAGDTGIHLVENQGADVLLFGEDILQGQHDPGQLTAGGDLCDGLQVLPGIGGHQEADGVTAILSGLLGLKANFKADLLHIQLPELRLDALLQVPSGGLPGRSQGLARRADFPLGGRELSLQAGQLLLRGLDSVQLPAAAVKVCQHVLRRGAVLLLQAVELVAAALHGVQLPRGEIELLPLIP